ARLLQKICIFWSSPQRSGMKWIVGMAFLGLSVGLWARLDVVASNGIVADWTRQVGGDAVAVTVFAGAGQDPHNFLPTPRQIGALADADLIIGFGEGMEPWLADAVQASGSRARILLLAEDLELMAPGEPF